MYNPHVIIYNSLICVSFRSKSRAFKTGQLFGDTSQAMKDCCKP